MIEPERPDDELHIVVFSHIVVYKIYDYIKIQAYIEIIQILILLTLSQGGFHFDAIIKMFPLAKTSAKDSELPSSRTPRDNQRKGEACLQCRS
jgi:hypothetical protein